MVEADTGNGRGERDRTVEADPGIGRGEPRPYNIHGDRWLGAVTAPMALLWYHRRGLPACGVWQSRS